MSSWYIYILYLVIFIIIYNMITSLLHSPTTYACRKGARIWVIPEVNVTAGRWLQHEMIEISYHRDGMELHVEEVCWWFDTVLEMIQGHCCWCRSSTGTVHHSGWRWACSDQSDQSEGQACRRQGTDKQSSWKHMAETCCNKILPQWPHFEVLAEFAEANSPQITQQHGPISSCVMKKTRRP